MVRCLQRRLAERTRGEEGAISILTAALLMAMLAATSLAYDVGQVAAVSRDQQGATERAALDALSIFDARPADTSEFLDLIITEVERSLDDNPAGPGAQDRTWQSIEIGQVSHGTNQFVPLDPLTSSSADVDAVRVTTTSNVPFIFPFPPGDEGRQVERVGIARLSEPVGSFAVGSGLLSLTSDGLLGDILNGTVCGLVELGIGGPCSAYVDLATWRGLVGSQVQFGQLIEELDLDAGQPSEVLALHGVLLGDLLRASANALDDAESPAAVMLNGLSYAVPTDFEIPLGQLFEIGVSRPGAAAEAMIDLNSLLTGVLFSSAIQVGNGQALISLTQTSLDVLGLAGLTASLTVIESPRLAVGPVGTQARTAQVRLELVPTVNLNLLAQVGVTLPLALGAAPVTGTLTAIDCPSEGALGIDVNSGLAEMSVGADPGAKVWTTVTRVTVPLLLTAVQVDLQARARISDQGDAVPLTVPVGGHQQAPAAGLSLNRLLSADELDVRAAGSLSSVVNLALAPVLGTTGLLATGLRGVVAPLEDAVLTPLSRALGLGFGNADVFAHDAQCGGRTLVRPYP